jgi:1,2-diacylglycerol 3-alpha-glucosyltransferase
MRILISNPILYTSEKAKVYSVSSIKDIMIYDLCLAFHTVGHTVTLLAAEDFQPIITEEYPFEIVFFKTKFKKICKPNCFPWMSGLNHYVKQNRQRFDLIISSEVFSLASLIYALTVKDKLIVWHELAKHNNVLKKIPSYIWHNVVARFFFSNVLVVPRSIEAKNFISNYCSRVYEKPVDHGVNLSLFEAKYMKDNSFIVCSQLINRKQIDGIIRNFGDYLKNANHEAVLNIVGAGEEKVNLIKLVCDLEIGEHVCFLGKLDHSTMMPYLSKAKALLVNTRKDNNLLSVVEALAVCTPVVMTSIPYNSSYIRANNLGIVKDGWDWRAMDEISKNNVQYVANCESYRTTLSTDYRVEEFIKIYCTNIKEGR